MNYKMLVSDFDNTLVSTDTIISKENKNAIKKLLDNNKIFVLASGRSQHALEIFEKELNLINENNYGISYNGAVIYNTLTREYIYEKVLSTNLGFEIISEIKKYNNIAPICYIDGHLCIEKMYGDILGFYGEKALVPVTILDDFFKSTGTFTKIIAIGEAEDLKLFYKDMIKKIDNRFNMFYSTKNLLEFTHLDATKGKALEFLTNYLNIPLNKAVTVGDNFNDISMLEKSDLGIAVKNAEDEVKKISNVILEKSCTENAIAEVIYKYFL